MSLLERRIREKVILKLIRKYLQSGIMVNGIKLTNENGVPQGGPLSPLLSNIILDKLDKELERRGHRFCRYADDCNIYVKSRRAGKRLKESITNFIEKKLKLKVNEMKSAVGRPWRRKFLGFSFMFKDPIRIRIAKESVKAAKQKIREKTSRSKPIPMRERIAKLNQFLVGWCNYFSLADTPSPFKELDEWIRRRLRMCLWKQWKSPKTRIKRLVSLGVPHKEACEWGNSRKKYWRMARSTGTSFNPESFILED